MIKDLKKLVDNEQEFLKSLKKIKAEFLDSKKDCQSLSSGDFKTVKVLINLLFISVGERGVILSEINRVLQEYDGEEKM